MGAVSLTRIYFACPACTLGGYPADERLGLQGGRSHRAEQMMTLAGVSQSFRQASSLLEGLAGWAACHEVIRQACYRQSDQLHRQRQADSPEIEPFCKAAGRMEFQADATKVNTLDGWRDMKVAVFARREAAPPAAPEEWNQRALPAPTVRFAFAAIEEIETFAPRWSFWAKHLDLGGHRLSVLGDGADWIWDHAGRQFKNWQGTLDIYHCGEWLAKAAKAGCGEGTAEAGRWLEGSRLALLRDGYAGLCEYTWQSLGWVANPEGLQGVTAEMLNYFCGRRDYLNFVLRLRQGEPIGSGLIEGACKQLIGRRMKQTGAQWQVGNANRMALLCSLAYADALPLYFNAA